MRKIFCDRNFVLFTMHITPFNLKINDEKKYPCYRH